MLFSSDRNRMRRYFCEAWRKNNAGEALEPLEKMIAEVIAGHPEYQPLLADPDDALTRDFSVEAGESNPFLHMGMHIAIQEQLTSGRPAGIIEIYKRLCLRFGDSHTVEHRMMECLGETLWEAQRSGAAPDEKRYLERLGELARRH